MKSKITDQVVRAMETPRKGKHVIYRDGALTGLGVRKTATGCTAFFFQYVINGRERRITIGQYPAWSVAAAREEAKRLRRRVDVGDDPLDDRRAAREEVTLDALWLDYRSEILPKKASGSQRNEKSIWDRLILPHFGKRKLSTITHRDMERLHNRISASTPAQANRCVASLSHVFATAVKWGLTTDNPAKGIKKNVELNRERYLSAEEKIRFMAALDKRSKSPSALALKFLLLTGARSGEVFKATWEQFDIENGVWTKPSAHTKQGRVHRVPLSSEALKLLAQARSISQSDIVFTGTSGKALTTVKTLFKNLRVEAGLADFRVHDLRHTFASYLVADGTSLPIVGRLLGHTQVATTNRYSHLEDAPLREAANRLARRVIE